MNILSEVGSLIPVMFEDVYKTQKPFYMVGLDELLDKSVDRVSIFYEGRLVSWILPKTGLIQIFNGSLEPNDAIDELKVDTTEGENFLRVHCQEAIMYAPEKRHPILDIIVREIHYTEKVWQDDGFIGEEGAKRVAWNTYWYHYMKIREQRSVKFSNSLSKLSRNQQESQNRKANKRRTNKKQRNKRKGR